VDAHTTPSTGAAGIAKPAGYSTRPPLRRFLTDCHEEFRGDSSGVLADYIPELTRANPDHFGIALVTIDGHVYEVGDSAVPFTIQSVSKAFVFALALETVGEARVSAANAILERGWGRGVPSIDDADATALQLFDRIERIIVHPGSAARES